MKTKLIILASLLVSLNSTGLMAAENKTKKEPLKGPIMEETSDKLLATVNNETIFKSEFDKVAIPMLEEFRKKNPDATDEKMTKLKTNILDEMINNKLIVQKAKEDKVPVSRRQLDDQIKNIKTQFGTEASFKAELRKENLTEEKFEERIKEQLMAEDLTYEQVTKKVTPPTNEEITKLLDMIKGKLNNEKLEITEQEEDDLGQLTKIINQYLSQKKAQKLYSDWVGILKKAANIKINPIE